MLVRMWNAENREWDLIPLTIPSRPRKGPRDRYLEVVDGNVSPDSNGDFIREDYTDEEIDAVHAFAVARLTIDLWEKAVGKKIVWPWNRFFNFEKLELRLYSKSKGARYSRDSQWISLGFWGPGERFVCKSFDVVAHETTHAIIESIIPDLERTNSTEGRAVVESLCDTVPILMQMRIKEFFDAATGGTKKNLRVRNNISEFGEGYGSGNVDGVRSALHPKQGDDHYSLGSRMTGTIYMHLIGIWERSASYEDFRKQVLEFSKTILRPITFLKEISPIRYFSEYNN